MKFSLHHLHQSLHRSLISLSVGAVLLIGSVIGLSNNLSQPVHATGNPLPINLPSQTVLKGSSKKVFAHYFTPYPISIDNVDPNSDYYTTQYLDPNGEGGIHAAYGGFLRERPLTRPVDPSPDWQLHDMETEVYRATNAGIDGFTVDMLDLDGTHWDRLNLLLQAAAIVDPNFKIVLMPDSNSSVVSDANTLASKIASIANSPSLYKLADGRLVVSPFYPEALGAPWWSNFVSIMQNTYGINVAFVPCFLDYPSNVDAFAPFSYGFSNWGNRSPAENTDLIANINDAHARGKIWMQPVSVQDNRPSQSIYDEANNTENLRTTWAAANSGADWVQIPTWNDYSENAQISPSSHIGWSPLDLNSYYLTQYKLGNTPTIANDTLYVSYRVQPYALQPTNQTQLMNLDPFSSPARDTVEVLSFLTAPSTISTTIAGKTVSYLAPAGVYSKTFPLKAGTVSAKAVRSGRTITTASGPYAVVSSRATQDLQYYFVSSRRQSTGLGW